MRRLAASTLALLVACAEPTPPAEGPPTPSAEPAPVDLSPRPSTPPKVRQAGGPNELGEAMNQLERRERTEVARLLDQGASCDALCPALKRQLQAKRTACAMWSNCPLEAIQALADHDEAVRGRGCDCPVPEDDLVEQPS